MLPVAGSGWISSIFRPCCRRRTRGSAQLVARCGHVTKGVVGRAEAIIAHGKSRCRVGKVLIVQSGRGEPWCTIGGSVHRKSSRWCDLDLSGPEVVGAAAGR